MNTQTSGGSEAPEPPNASEFARGSTVGRYVILGKVGEGGMGVVYAAYDPELDRKLALKVLRKAEEHRAEARRLRLAREAQAMARLSHRNVISVHDVGRIDDQVFVAMEFIEGESLTSWLRSERAWPQIIEVFVQAGHGLAAAHRAGLVHRDFKPDNVMVTRDGRVVVTDFGLARATGGVAGSSDDEPMGTGRLATLSTTVTAAGAIMGTPAYMAPEQHDGGRVHARSDQFAFAVALYEALYGERPFPGEDLASLAYHVGSGHVRPAPPRTSVPSWVRRVLLRALSVDPDERYPSMDGLLVELGRDRRLRPGWGQAAAGLGLTAIIGLYVGYALDPAPAPCRQGDHHVDAAIGPGPRLLAKAAFLGTGLTFAEEQWPAVDAAIAGYGSDWVRVYTDACEATRLRGEYSETVLDARMSCLGRRLEDASVLLALFRGGDQEAVENALAAVQALPPPSTCAEVRGRTEAKTSEGEGEDGWTPPLTRVASIEGDGTLESGLRAAQELREQTLETNDPMLRAETHFRLASLERAAGDEARAIADFRESVAAALEAGDDDLAAEAAVGLVGSMTGDPDRSDEAEGWAAVGEALLARVGARPDLRAELFHHEAKLLEHRDRFEDAETMLRQALMLLEAEHGPDDFRVAESAGALAVLLHRAGRCLDARPWIERSVEGSEYTVGLEHPHTAKLLRHRAAIAVACGDPVDAVESLERVLAIQENSPTTTVSERIETWTALAVALDRAGQIERAWAVIDRARLDCEGELEPFDPGLANVRVMAARLALRRGDAGLGFELARSAMDSFEQAKDSTTVDRLAPVVLVAEALVALEREALAKRYLRNVIESGELALAIQGRGRKARDAEAVLADALTLWGEIDLLRHHAADALPYLERAFLLHDDTRSRIASARTRFALARALGERESTLTRAQALAREASESLRDEPSAASLREELTVWQLEHDAAEIERRF